MKDAGRPGKKSSGNKSILFAGLGVVFLFLMAITSSIDVSFVYVFTGASTLFFFLAVRAWLQNSRHESGTGHYNRDPGRSGVVDPSPTQTVSEVHHRQPIPEPQKQKKKEPRQEIKGVDDAKSKFKLMGCVVAVIVLSFFGIIAIILFTAIFDDDSTDLDKLYYDDTARSYYDSHQYDSAALNYRRALKLDENYEEAQLGYGKTLLYGLQQYDSALIMFNIILEDNPEYTDAQEHRGLTYYYQKKYDLALNEAFDILERNPTYTQSMLLAGDCYYDQKNYDETIKWYQKAYDLGERGKNLAWNMAFIYDTQGNSSKAIKFYKETLEYGTSLDVVEIYRRLSELVQGDSSLYYKTREYQLRQQAK
jgi:tetratricopeptide (TPR) repeat protein